MKNVIAVPSLKLNRRAGNMMIYTEKRYLMKSKNNSEYLSVGWDKRNGMNMELDIPKTKVLALSCF